VNVSSSFSPEKRAYLLGTTCILVLGCVLVAGLWPFHAPRNGVGWLGDNGIFLGRHGSLISEGAFEVPRASVGNACSLEIWLAPHRVDSAGTILSFYQSATNIIPFSLRQSLGDLVIQRFSPNQTPRKSKSYVEVFRDLKPVFVTITSGPTGLNEYMNGNLVRKSTVPLFSGRNLAGQLVIGNAPTTTDSWSGQLSGLAIYDRELSAADVSLHYQEWIQGRPPTSTETERIRALYRFDEGKGSVAHNQSGLAPDLRIPDHFFVLREPFLERPWDEFHPDWVYCKDVAINIIGLTPLGFFFNAYLSVVKKSERATGVTIIVGFATSFAIEVLQSFLPTRDSGMTDLFTNTFGTAIGAVIFVWLMKRDGFGRIGFPSTILSKT
jgi:hypothetical protein